MALIKQVATICNRLASKGWHALFDRHGLDITAPNLEQELKKTLPNIGRGIPGFEDFARDGNRGIEPGSPAGSLLYHGLASPAVHPTQNGEPSNDPDAYPTIEELDTIENYIYSLKRVKGSDLSKYKIAVFAYQYRTRTRSPHGFHADLAFSRTGIARVGTAVANYDAKRRGYWVEAADGNGGIAVMPVRYAAFLAEVRLPGPEDAIMEQVWEDGFRDFVFPVHKLFPGDECLVDLTIEDLQFHENHRNEKLYRLHDVGKLPLSEGFDIFRSSLWPVL